MPADPFRTRDHVPDFDEKVREYERRSVEVRSVGFQDSHWVAASRRDINAT
jgi:hypothetical protein